MRRDAAALFSLVTAGFLFVLVWFFDAQWQYFAGAVLGLSGLAMIWRAVYDLGQEFKVMPGSARLVTSGIYSKLRHPTYIGLALLLFGWAAVVRSERMAEIALMVSVVNLVRAYMEEKRLEERFGKRYREYKKRTWF